MLTKEQLDHFDFPTLETAISLHSEKFEVVATNMKNGLFIIHRLRDAQVKAEHEEEETATKPTFSDDVINESKDLLRKLEHILHLTQEVACRVQS